MLKLSEPADLREESNIRTICLPFIAFGYPQSMDEELNDHKDENAYDAIPIRDNNFLRNIRITQRQWTPTGNHSTRLTRQSRRRSHTRRNDKFLHGTLYTGENQSSRNLQVYNGVFKFDSIWQSTDFCYRIYRILIASQLDGVVRRHRVIWLTFYFRQKFPFTQTLSRWIWSKQRSF